jgi:class 3 adenylate cyclase
LAAMIPNAKMLELPGEDHLFTVGDNRHEIYSAIQEFLTGARPVPVFDRVLATVLMTDIVGSTRRAELMGDQNWRDLLNMHDRAVREQLSRFRGNEVKSLGDGFLATFDGPARALQCARAIRDATAELDMPVRIGVHTGEVELSDSDVRGIAVHIAARITDLGNANDVVLSRTVKDLVVGSGLEFDEFGVHALKGVSDEWQLYRIAA